MPGILFSMSAITQRKATLRQQLRQQRNSLASAERAAASDMIASQTLALPKWAQINSVAIYSPNDGEVDPHPLATRALAQNKTLFLPVIQADNTLHFARWEPGDSLNKNKFGIGEPSANIERVLADSLDLICIPLVGWSSDGNRLGMGGGFYDRTLNPASNTTRVGLGYDCQECADIPCEHWDIRLHWVATQSRLLRCQNTSAENYS